MQNKMNSQEVFDHLIKNKEYNASGLVSRCLGHISINENDSMAMNNLGYIYRDFYKDNLKAEEWYTKSINLGNTFAMVNMGNLQEDVYKNYSKAEEWYTKSADLGNGFAMCDLGYIYSNIYKDNIKAEEWYIKSMNLGNNCAMHYLGLLYYDNKEYKKAYDILIKIDKSYININMNDVKDLLFFCKQKLITLDKIYGLSSIESDECIICRDTLMKTNNSIIILVCGHMYHNNCVKDLKKCPCCSYKMQK